MAPNPLRQERDEEAAVGSGEAAVGSGEAAVGGGEEAAVGVGEVAVGVGGAAEPYRDDSDEDNWGPDAPLVNHPASPTDTSGRPSLGFDGLRLGGQSRDDISWQHRLATRVPGPLRRAWTATLTCVQGPDPPRIYTITPLFPKLQHAPLTLLNHSAPRPIHRILLYLLWSLSWLLTFSLILRASSFSASIPTHGSPVRLSCSARYWSEGNYCGLNGDECRPFSNATLAFRCPADCHKTQVLNPHAVGDQEVVYKPLVVGGPAQQQTGFEEVLVEDAVYRGDSFVCASAVHAGFINDAEGGCGVLTLTGEQTGFTSSRRHGIESTAFDSYFPHSFGFLRGTRASCKDLRWPALAVSVFFTVLLGLFTTDPLTFFCSSFVILFFQTALATDPPSLTNYYSLLSVAFGRFLPACFCAWVTYRYTVHRSLTNLTAQIEKCVLWLGAAWRLTPHDIKSQPGAIPALILIVLAIFFIALGQAWAFRVEGRMPRYLAIYGLMVTALLLMLAIPGLNLRIHHYILALLLLPGTSFQNRPSLLYQGLLIGLFVNGIARWGFDSILQTPYELLKGAQQGTLLPDVRVLAMGESNITFGFGRLPVWDERLGLRYDGVSVLVNDVERFRGFVDGTELGEQEDGNLTWTWKRHQVGRERPVVSITGDGAPVPWDPEAETTSLLQRRRVQGRDDDDDDDDDDGSSSEFFESALSATATTTVVALETDVDTETDREALGVYEAWAQTVWPEYFRFAYMAGSLAGDFGEVGVWTREGEWVGMGRGVGEEGWE
ncbi:LCCL domain [Teratosphaeria destructans]|uniref:LCCL domain n=1 Tax=Teratosphaeria destructans TaxID=418781 RepID=A0A9W7T1K1_9PEZI|nr:LCCL domain [Teratosphaeria destructans]